MNKLIVLVLILSASAARSQQNYATELNIPFYPQATVAGDAYLASKCALDIYYPKNKKDFATIVWFHGGGLTGGAKEIPQALMDKGYAVIAVGYRLSPMAKAPAYIEDAAAAVAWAFKRIAGYGGSSRQIYLSGHSAGAYLTMMIALDKRYLAKYDVDADKIAGLIPFSGQCITHFTIRNERGIRDIQPLIDEFAPLYWVRPSSPPMLLITGDAEKEMLGRYEENAYMARMMKLAGHKNTRLFQLQGFDHNSMAGPAFQLLLTEVAERQKQVR